MTYTIHVWYIYLHLVDFMVNAGKIYNTWILYDPMGMIQMIEALGFEASLYIPPGK